MTEPLLDLEAVTAASAQEHGAALREAAKGASHRRRAAERIVDYLYDRARDPKTGERTCVLARCFQTSAYAQLPFDYQDAADKLLEEMAPHDDLRCLNLLATRGAKITWNDPATSIGHLAIPLPSAEVVRRAPMISRLLEEMGMSAEQVVASPSSPDFLLTSAPRSFNVFHVPEALGSPFIPAQSTFVEPFGVRSVVGLGGLLPDGSLFAVLLFTRVAISRENAASLQVLAASASEALAPFGVMQIFSGR